MRARDEIRRIKPGQGALILFAPPDMRGVGVVAVCPSAKPYYAGIVGRKENGEEEFAAVFFGLRPGTCEIKTQDD
jgi:hypothetical protein